MSENKLPTVTFIIPHKGREEMLIDTLRSITEQDYPTESLEVIIVSQNESASDQLSKLREQLNLTVIFKKDDSTISHSRNLGAQRAIGDYFAFLDADIELSKNWIAQMIATLDQPNIVLASAMQINSKNAPPLERIRTGLSNAELDTTVNFLPGRNLFLARGTFDKVGGFPEHLITCEDYYFTDQVAKLGGLFYTSKATYVHIGEDKDYYPMFKKEIWRGQSNLASLQGRTIPLREIPSFIVPVGIVACFMLALIFAIAPAFTSINTDISAALAPALILLGMIPVLAYTLRLKRLVGDQVSLLHCFWFYVSYFPARAIGTVMGLSKTVTTNSHK